jgi:soluble lytic murein transglycosylase
MVGLMSVLASLNVLAESAGNDERDRFRTAWDAAARGDRGTFEQLRAGLTGYSLYPYLQYEHYRHHRSSTPAGEMAGFLEQHSDWAFAPGLRTAWLNALARQRKWSDLLAHAGQVSDTRLRCHLARARIEQGDTEALLAEVQALWTVGHSQSEACDPAFDWLRQVDGISPALAWERVRLVMAEGNWRLAGYLERYLPESDRTWAQQWRTQFRARYRRIGEAGDWPDSAIPRMIAASSLQDLARRDPDLAMREYRDLEHHFSWSELERAEILRAIGLRAAVELSDDALNILASLPPASLDGQVLEWWARAAIAQQDWRLLKQVTERMPAELANDAQWRYWRAISLQENGETEAAAAQLADLSTRTSYYGFLAADALDLPYTICPLDPPESDAGAARLRQHPAFARALELRAVGLEDWALWEWARATRALDPAELRDAAALAWEESWYDRAIFALGDSGDRRLYEWRFPTPWEAVVRREASKAQLDASWVFGVMRSESALAERAESSAGALGLMQVMPATARQVARRHGLTYGGSAQLREAEPNIVLGTRYMRELLDRFQQNPVLVAGAYNAGPQAVERWLRERPADDITAWVETIPYYETRDYIPRVLAFTVIYDWRLGNPVKRVSSRMPGFDLNAQQPVQTSEVVCLAPTMEAP